MWPTRSFEVNWIEVMDSDLETGLKSLFHAKFDNGQWSSYGSSINTNIWTSGSVPDGTSGECAKVVNDNGEFKIDSADCLNIGPFVCEKTVSTGT